VQNEEGRMRVEFDEPWAKEGFKEAQADEMEAEATPPAEGAAAASGASAAA
jgi:DNA topoisomerase-3